MINRFILNEVSYFGPGAREVLPQEISRLGYKKAFVATDKDLIKFGVADKVLKVLEGANIPYEVFSEIKPNPTVSNVKAGVEAFAKSGADFIIAIGGGSSMDCAKAIGAMHVKNKEVEQMQGLFRVLHRIPTIFAVPTTAGTGSETTVAAVITNSKTSHKASMNDVSLMPKYAVMDPELTAGLPPHITATTGMDALCHAVEAYTNNTYNTRKEKNLAEKAVKLIYENLYTAYCDGSNLEARINMQDASFYAGRAFTRGCVGYVHAVGHTLGGLYGVPHGLAMSVILPHVMRQFGPAAHERLARLAEVCGMDGANDAEKAEKFIKWIEDLKHMMNIPVGLDVIEDKDVNQIIKWAMKEANPLYPTPVTWKKKDFQKLIATIRQTA